METDTKADGCAVHDAGGGHAPLIRLYESVCRHVEQSRQKQTFAKLCSRVAPSGNIYRYIGFRQERLRHCLDLGRQLDALAYEHRELLGGSGQPLEKRRERLKELLGQAVPRRRCRLDDLEAERGFIPLEELLGERASSVGLVVVPSDADAWRMWRRNHFTAWLVLLIQILAPPLIMVQQWYSESNLLLQPRKLWRHLTVKEFLCVGSTPAAALTNVVGTLLLIMVITMVCNYVEDERDNAKKQGRLPLDNFWALASIVCNSWCCLVITLAIPLELWSEDGLTGIIMNAMALLFIFTIDDLTGDAFGYLGMDESSFQRTVSWNYALLAYTPVQIRDLTNPRANVPEELWQISYDPLGRLEAFQEAAEVSASGKPAATPLCLTRVAPAPGVESTRLLAAEEEEADVIPEAVYRVSRKGTVWYLPGKRALIIRGIWEVVDVLLKIVWWTVPAVFFIVNKPCYDAV